MVQVHVHGSVFVEPGEIPSEGDLEVDALGLEVPGKTEDGQGCWNFR